VEARAVRPLDELRKTFAPYELALGAVLIQIAFLFTGFAFLFLGRGPVVLLAFVPSVAAGMFAHLAVHCPRCRKSPMRYYMTARGEARGGLPMGQRAWPERRCSSCGTSLDIL
jgi:hypothetical protein